MGGGPNPQKISGFGDIKKNEPKRPTSAGKESVKEESTEDHKKIGRENGQEPHKKLNKSESLGRRRKVIKRKIGGGRKRKSKKRGKGKVNSTKGTTLKSRERRLQKAKKPLDLKR